MTGPILLLALLIPPGPMRSSAQQVAATGAPRSAQEMVEVDSLRKAGNRALVKHGLDAARPLWEQSYQLADARSDTVGMARALGNLGALELRRGHLTKAQNQLARAEDFARSQGDDRTAANAIGNRATAHREAGELEVARQLYEDALALREQIGDTRGIAADRQNMGIIAQQLGDYTAAAEAYEFAYDLNRRDGRGRLSALNLINLAGVRLIEGRYEEAADLYERASDVGRTENAMFVIAGADLGLGMVALRRGMYRVAVEKLGEAVDRYESGGYSVDAVRGRASLAAALASVGNLSAAVETLVRAEEQATEVSEVGLRAGLVLTRADLDLQFNRFEPALVSYLSAERLFAALGDLSGVAAATDGAAYLSLVRGDTEAALAYSRRALTTQVAAGGERAVAVARLRLASSLAESGAISEAEEMTLLATRALRSLGDDVGTAAGLTVLGDLYLADGRSIVAEEVYRDALTILQSRTAPDVAWRARSGRGHALQALDVLDGAASEYQLSLDIVEATYSTALPGAGRADFMRDKWDLYVDLALLEARRSRPSAAFDASQRLRARGALALLERGRIDTQQPDGAEQDRRFRLQELTDELLTVQYDPRLGPAAGPPGIGPVHRGDDQLESAVSAAHAAYDEARFSSAGGRSAALPPLPITAAAASAMLEPDEVLLEYLVTDSAAMVLVITPADVAAIELGTSRQAIGRLVEFARGAITDIPAEDDRSLWRSPLRRLYEVVIGPVEAAGHLENVRRLYVVPHGPLSYLPFAALVTGTADDAFLIERFEVVRIPSASALGWLRSRRSDYRPISEQRILALAPMPAALPASESEVEAVAALYGTRATVLRGADATEAALRSAIAGYDIIHLATRGALNRVNPLFSSVELGRASGTDGMLEVHEVFGLKLSARLVTLSACETALGADALAFVQQGDELVSLVRAFLHAGSENVVATLWPVEDQATAAVMARFYAALAGGETEAGALARAQRAAVGESALRHPYYWAGFTISGSGGTESGNRSPLEMGS